MADNLEIIKNDISHMKEDIAEMRADLKEVLREYPKRFVSHKVFWPVITIIITGIALIAKYAVAG